MNLKPLLFALLLILTSCASKKDVAYFQDFKDKQNLELPQTEAMSYEIKIETADLLSINVSCLDPNAVALFNLPAASYLVPGQTQLLATPILQSYLVDSQGYIDYPILGKIKAQGLTRLELTAVLKEKISVHVKDPLINIHVLNFKISVLGEVNSPGLKGIGNEKVSIIDAIGMAGDLNIFGERTNILLIRTLADGSKELHRLDLTSTEILNSPYYYLKQNDVIYVEPNKARKGNAAYSQSAQFNVSVAATIVGAVSTIASLAIALFIK